jgi:ubiquinone/menaquinone biosynthesis C-methylase UbiE
METSEIKNKYNKELPAKFGNDYEYNRWFKNEHLRSGYEMTSEALRKFLPDLEFKTYIEIGPGPGTWTKFFVNKSPDAEFHLVDISSKMLSIAKKNLADVQRVKFTEGDFMDFKHSKEFDLFFSSRAIEYIKDKNGLTKKIIKTLSKGGTGIIITKTPKYLRRKLLRKRSSSFHSGQISPGALTLLLKKSGLKDIKTYPAVMVFPILKSVFLDKALFRLFGKRRLNVISKFFSESYIVIFKK